MLYTLYCSLVTLYCRASYVMQWNSIKCYSSFQVVRTTRTPRATYTLCFLSVGDVGQEHPTSINLGN